MDLIEIGENQRGHTRCQPSEADTFTPDNVKKCEKYVRNIQRRLDKAVANDDSPKIRWYSHLLAKRSRASKVIAVHQICEVNKGRHTAGVDGVAMPKDRKERLPLMIELLNSINIDKKPSPIRRVPIPKPNGGTRPLGIPTIADRINQDIIRRSIEPIVEYYFLPCSHGFRPKRRCQDAIEDLFTKLSRRNSARWVIEGDIKGCFDHINHDHIISTLTQWQTPERICRIIKRMLKANIVWNEEIINSDSGTPQGGVISPMLANVALTCLDKEILDRYGKRKSDSDVNRIVRYADDFIIVTWSKDEAEEVKTFLKGYLKTQIGVELSDKKTHITEINRGFDFLGFNFRKLGRQDNEKLYITPSKDSVKRILKRLKEKFNQMRNSTAEALIQTINPIISGWGNYYRFVNSKFTYSTIGNKIWEMTWRWVRRKHPKSPKRKVAEMYYRMTGNNKWVFQSEKGYSLASLKNIPIKRYIKVKSDKRVYNVNDRKYWEKREYVNAKNSIYGSPTLTILFNAQRGKCEWCGKSITKEQIETKVIDKHHIKPRSEGGTDKLGNLQLLHTECHKTLHNNYSRKEMAKLANNGINYLRLLKPQSSY